MSATELAEAEGIVRRFFAQSFARNASDTAAARRVLAEYDRRGRAAQGHGNGSTCRPIGPGVGQRHRQAGKRQDSGISRDGHVTMGTNYYWHEDPCPTCERSDELHIYKSCGMFEGHFKGEDPFLTSWADWKAFLLDNGGRITDEYDREHDLESFIVQVESIPTKNRRQQYDYAVEAASYSAHRCIDKVERGGDWLDADEFSFYGGDFC